MTLTDYEVYARQSLEEFAARKPAERFLLVEAVKDLKIERLLDLGCGAGQEILPFLEKTSAFCVGVDIASEIGKVTRKIFSEKKRAVFIRAKGEKLPFADESFELVLCRVALPYMNNRQTIAEVARVLKKNGVFLLKTHAPEFYLAMMKARLKTLNPKKMAYPIICLAGGLWHVLTGRQPEKGFWKGKEVFQTRRFLEKEFDRNKLKIERVLADDNPQTPSFFIVKRCS
jgi:SAM-dependent methyltransferase